MKVDYKDLPDNGRGSPELNYCRELIKQGVNPKIPIDFYRGDMKCFVINSIEGGAKWTTGEEPRVHFRKYREFNSKVYN